MEKTVIGTGIFNLDIIVKRDYPEWPQLRPFTDNVVMEEVGRTCGNVMCMLSWMSTYSGRYPFSIPVIPVHFFVSKDRYLLRS